MSQPNILLILTDQQRVDTLGFRGLTACQTPNLDRLARDGTSFDRALSPSPICGPARCALFTGQYPHQVRSHPEPDQQGLLGDMAFDSDAHDMMLNDYSCLASPLLTESLKAQGYHTAYAGKWHLGNDRIGAWFDRFAGNVNQHYMDWLQANGLPETGWPLKDPEVRSTRTPRMSIPRAKVSPILPDQTNDAWIADIALDFIRTRPEDQPFFTVCSFNGPHPPFMIPEPYFSMCDPRDVPEPPNFRAADGEPDCKQKSFYRQLWHDQGEDWAAWQKPVAVYWGFVRLIDDQVGRLLECLDEEGILDETLVVFCSDHGEMLGQHGLWHKMQPYEESLRVPLVMRGPGVECGVRNSSPASLIDVAPTILAAAGASAPAVYQGQDLHQSLAEDRILFSEQKPLGPWHGEVDWRLACDATWKYVWNRGDREELYHLPSDPGELYNQADSEGCAEPKTRLRNALQDWMRQTGDPLTGALQNSFAPNQRPR